MLPAIGAEKETTEWHRHTWYDNPMTPADSLTISLLWIGRETSSFWPDLSMQFQRVRLTLNQTFENASAGLGYESWLYGDWSSPAPPPPP